MAIIAVRFRLQDSEIKNSQSNVILFQHTAWYSRKWKKKFYD